MNLRTILWKTANRVLHPLGFELRARKPEGNANDVAAGKVKVEVEAGLSRTRRDKSQLFSPRAAS